MSGGSEDQKQKFDIVSELIYSSEMGDDAKIREFLNSDAGFSNQVLDIAIRKCITNFKEGSLEYLNCFEYLVDEIPDINYRNSNFNNSTILMAACVKIRIEILDILLKKKKLDSKITDSKNNSFLHYLINLKNNEIIVIQAIENIKSAQKEIDFNSCSNEGLTPLSLALVNGFSKLTEYLIYNKANVKHVIAPTGNGMLHCAVEGKNVNCLKFLGGLNPKMKNLNQVSPFDLAEKYKLTHIKKVLTMIGKDTFISLIINNEDGEKFVNEWNFLLFEYYYVFLSKENNENDLKFFIEENDIENFRTEKKRNIDPSKDFRKEIKNFFEKNSDKIQSLNCFQRSFLIYNYRIYLFKIGAFTSAIKLPQEVFSNNEINDNFLNFFNSSLIIIEILIAFRIFSFCDIILNNLESILNSYYDTSDDKKNNTVKKCNHFIDYYNFIGTLNNFGQSEPLYATLHLFRALRWLGELNFNESKKNLSLYKKYEIKLKSDFPIFKTLDFFYKSIKCRLHFFGNQTKFLKQLNYFTLKEAYIGESHLSPELVYLNNLGIFNLKNKKYFLSEISFKNLLKKLKIKANAESRISNMTYFYNVHYNLGLAYFFQKYYSKALSIFNLVVDHFKCYPFIYYRIGICLLEIEFGKRIKENSLKYSEILDSISTFARNDGSTEKIAKKYILNRLSIKSNEKLKSNEIQKAISSFKQTILIIENQTYISKNITEEISKVYKFPDVINEENPKNEGFLNKSLKQLYHSCLFHLIFCLIQCEIWNEALFIIRKIEKSDHYKKENKAILDNYKILCLINLNLQNEALEILKKHVDSNNDWKFFYLHNQSIISNEISYKVSLYLNILKIQFHLNNLGEAQKIICLILNLLNVNFQNEKSFDVPSYVMNVIVYYLVLKENFHEAICLIKRRRISQSLLKSINFTNLSGSKKSII